MTDAARNYQAEADALLVGFSDGLSPAETAIALAVLVNRAATRLHTLTRAEAAALKGEPTWSAWAALQNAARTLILHASTARDLASRLTSARS